MRTLGNVLWFIFGGWLSGLLWFLIGAFAFITIVGIPWGRACFVLGKFSLWPFGREAISRKDLKNKSDIGTGVFGSLGNVVWFIFGGLWLAIVHLVLALASFVTIIGIPFGIQHLKLAGASLTPIGKTVVKKELAKAAHEANARDEISAIRNEKKGVTVKIE